MIRTSKHTLKFANKSKLNLLDMMFCDYEIQLKYYIDLILNGKLDLKNNLSSKLLPNYIISHSRWKQIIYKNASEIVRSNIKKSNDKRYRKYKKVYSYFKKQNRQLKFTNKRFSELKLNSILKYIKIDIKNITITLDSRLLSFENDSLQFNEFVGIKLPYFQENKKLAIQVNLPINYHKHSLKFKDWARKKSLNIKKVNNCYYIELFYEKEFIQNNKSEKLGFDIGYNKLLSCSNNEHYGIELKQLYNKISNKKQGSKNFLQTLHFRDTEINRIINNLNLENINEIFVEDLKNVKHKSKFSKKFNNKLQRWTYSKVLNKFHMLCEENGIILTKVDPSFTSQICSSCGFQHKDNRNNELFKCLNCNLEIDADTNASLNILHRGKYSSSTKESNIFT